MVGCYLLSLLTEEYGQSIGLYRDNGLAAFNKTPQQIEKIKKEMCKIFRDHGLKITIEANKTIVNFLDITLALQSGKHYPFTKEGNIPLYMHKKSNHPPSILKNILDSINKRLSEISSDRECFEPMCTKKHSIKVAIITTSHIKSHTVTGSDHGEAVQETYFGAIHLSARM